MQNTNQSSQDNAMRHSILSDMQIASPTLARLIEEVKNDNQSTPYAYDRVHNRHNR